MLFGNLFKRQTSRIVSGLRMIGDTEILETALARRFRHRLQRLCADRGGCVTVENAMQVFVADKLRQAVLRCLRSFAELRLKLQVQRFVNIVLRPGGDEFLPR